MTSGKAKHLRCGIVALAVVTSFPVLAACGDGRGGDAADHATPEGVSTGRRLTVVTDNGVRLRPASGDRVTIVAHTGHRWSGKGDHRVLDLSCPDGADSRDPCPRMPEVDIPAGTGVTVSARNAGIDAAGVSGALDLTTVNGDVTVTDAGRTGSSVRLTTRNGSVRAHDLRAATLHAQTVNGDVTVGCATAPSRIDAATTNGSVDATVPDDSPAYRVNATTDNGRPRIDIPTATASHAATMRLATVNGDVRAERG
ncbi:DUF4097 domain-containing protein [Streptomyces sp. SID14478]|uniref:DUF4097 family beta strand repeat-containing protein n=1 Tax=Streptomyces sp. SID14478 TaxID=2706073 RepID=UPI0013E02011|nr:DUF4097 family beta strand repeat-containing protein [Streptomyces sp. SID14478]NEB80662.1 DUF4097 domain-containing protein [Streptomyces sp. SID14478]